MIDWAGLIRFIAAFGCLLLFLGRALEYLPVLVRGHHPYRLAFWLTLAVLNAVMLIRLGLEPVGVEGTHR